MTNTAKDEAQTGWDKLDTRSRVVFQNQHYVACITRAGLSVQSKKKGNGKLLPLGSKAFTEWLGSLETAIDTSESNTLCRAIYQGAPA